MDLTKMEATLAKGNFWKCAIKVTGGMITGAGVGSMVGTGFLPGFGTAFGAAVGLYAGGRRRFIIKGMYGLIHSF